MRRHNTGWLLVVVVLLLVLWLGSSASGQRSELSEIDAHELLRTQARIANSLEEISRSLDRIAALQERQAP